MYDEEKKQDKERKRSQTRRGKEVRQGEYMSASLRISSDSASLSFWIHTCAHQASVLSGVQVAGGRRQAADNEARRSCCSAIACGTGRQFARCYTSRASGRKRLVTRVSCAARCVARSECRIEDAHNQGRR